MADSVHEVIKVTKLLGFDYTKFENTKLSAEKRKNSCETNKMRKKKILVSPVRAYHTAEVSVERATTRSKLVVENVIAKPQVAEGTRSQSRPILDKGNKKLKDAGSTTSRFRQTSKNGNNESKGIAMLYNSGRKSVDPNKLAIAQFRKQKSEIKDKRTVPERNCGREINNKKSNDKTNVKCSAKEKPLVEIKRRLDFENNDEIGDEPRPLPSGLDFTDKIAALRSLIHRERETMDITDRRAYYDEYRSKPRKVMVSRSDSLKENLDHSSVKDTGSEKDKVRDNMMNRKSLCDRQRKVQSADLFKHRTLGGRMSVMDMHVLKERLEEKHAHNREKIDESTGKRMKCDTVNSRNDVLDKYVAVDKSLLHATKGRKIIAAASRNSVVERETSEPIEDDSRPSSRCESKETQTNQLNMSIRSVQSNVPFYEPRGRVLSAAVLNCELSVCERICRNRDTNLCCIDAGVDVPKMEYGSPSKDYRHTNLHNFVGTSLMPEQSKSGSRFNDCENKQLEKKDEILSRKKTTKRNLDPGNHRPSSTNSQIHVGRNKAASDTYSSLGKKYRLSDNQTKDNNAVVGDEIVNGKHDTKFVRTQKSDRKVREWIKNQEKILKDKSDNLKSSSSGAMTMEELIVSKSVTAGSSVKMHQSPSDSYDKIPVKLEKPKNEKYHTLNSNAAYGIIQPHAEGIDDRLEHITLALVNQQHDLEIPVKDIQIVGDILVDSMVARNSQGRLVDNWDTASTESSVFSLPISVQSGESISSTCQAVKLLRKLYHVDAETRQNLVLMAKCFRRWFNNVLHARTKNLQISQSATRFSPISYGVMLRKSDTCYRTRVLSQYLNAWKTASRNAGLHKQVVLLHRRHMLQKGMNAFKWAINRSKLQQAILQDRVNTMLLHSIFAKWKFRTLENRHVRLQQAFCRWRQFTKEAQKIRMLRNQINIRLKERIFLEWYERYQTCLKQHKADKYARQVLLCGGLVSWRCYTVVCRKKKARHTLAVQLLQCTLQRKMFTTMKLQYDKYTVAKHFYRLSQLKVAMVAWNVGMEMSKHEREENQLVAEVYSSRTTLRTHFTAWRDALLTNRACRFCDNYFTKNAFRLWNKRYEQFVQRRQAVDNYTRQKSLTRAFQHWYTFVVVMKQRRVAAVQCLQSVLQRHMFEVWRQYARYQRNLRRRLLLLVRKHCLNTQKYCLSVWRSQFTVRCDDKRAQRLWSNSCARRAAEFWRLVCHRKKLARLLIDTEPVRQLTMQTVYFVRWKARFHLILEERQEASDVRAILDHSQLKAYFDKWQTDTKQLILIKPLLLQYKQRLLAQCFDGWHRYVVRRAECVSSAHSVILVRLCNKFRAWRRQYLVHQIGKDFNKKLQQRRAHQCVQAWRFVVQRKHGAQQFHHQHLVKSTFLYWSTLALRQLRQKRLQNMKTESVLGVLRAYFGYWRERLYTQQNEQEECVLLVQQQIQTDQIKIAFYFWRRHFRATLVARENEKIHIRRLAKQALLSWSDYTQNSLHEAVQKFAAAIELPLDDRDTLHQHVHDLDHNMEDKEDDADQPLGKGESLEILNFDLEKTSYSMTPITPRSPHTPRPSSDNGTPLRRLYSPSPSHLSLAQSLEFDAGALMSSSFLDARFEMEHAVKIESRREIVVSVVNRLRHWPVSIVFEQWKEYTSHQKEFKRLTAELLSTQKELTIKLYFTSWILYYQELKVAKQHYEQVLQHKALLSLLEYRKSRKDKTRRNVIARLHYTRKVYTDVFPMWLAKALEKQHAEKIVHLWTNITDEERELIPRERSFRHRLNKKLLNQCFSMWRKKYQRISKLKNVYHNLLYERYFVRWCNWALERHDRNVKCEQFREQRRKTLVFKTWCLRYTQKREVEKRYEDSWNTYLAIIMHSWCQWVRDERKRKVIAAYVTRTREHHLVATAFTVWKTESEKQMRITLLYQTRLSLRVLCAWQRVTSWQKDLKLKQVQCQLMSYTAVAKRAFRQWRTCYQQRLAQHKQQKWLLHCNVLSLATRWRRKAQKTRSHKLYDLLQTRNVGRMFEKWNAAYRKNMSRYGQLEMYIKEKHVQLTSVCLDTWRTELMCLQAHRVFNMKLLATVAAAWTAATKGCRKRREALQRHVAIKEHNTQKGFFLYWYNMAKARKSIRGHANLKMQLTVFKSWLVYTRKKNNIRRLDWAFTRKRNVCIMQTHWYLVKTRFDYCIELSDVANRVIRDKHTTLMRQALQHWHFRLKVTSSKQPKMAFLLTGCLREVLLYVDAVILQIVIADECHQHILAKRTTNRWHQFVLCKRQERQQLKQQMQKAVQFYNKKICNKVYNSWFNEVLATRLVEKRKSRLCCKYGQWWKRKTDMVYTANCLRNENVCLQAWRRWQLEFARRKTIHKFAVFEKKLLLSKVFISWRNLSEKRVRKISMIPLPVSPAYNMPSAVSPVYNLASGASSGSSTPTEELFSPSKTSQIPTQMSVHNSVLNRRKSLSARNSTMGGCRNSPTGSMEK